MPRIPRAASALAVLAATAAVAPTAASAASPDQAIDRFRQDATGAAKVVLTRGSERASFIAGDVSAAALGGAAKGSAPLARTAIDRYAGALGATSASTQLRQASATTDATGARRVVYEQVVGGVPVFERRVVVSLAPDGSLRAIASGFLPGVGDVPTTPAVAQPAAEATAAQVVPGKDLTPTRLVVFAGARPDASQARLAWAVDRLSADGTTHQLVMVDAQRGDVLQRIDRIADARDRRTYTANNGTTLPGSLVLSESSSTAGADADAAAVHTFVGETYDYYAGTFGRDSYDGAGATLTSTVHYDRNYENAFWNGEQMVYGDGFATDDVTAHELTHAVTERTAGLNYQDQSGALNESISDMAGWDVDPGDSTLGEDLPIGAIRDMEDPAAYDQPATAADYVCTLSDSGGVHTNSGIPNKVYANLVDTIGRADAEQVRYRAQTTYLQPDSSFADARAAFEQAATDVGADATAVGAAWEKQGVTRSWAPACGLVGGLVGTLGGVFGG